LSGCRKTRLTAGKANAKAVTQARYPEDGQQHWRSLADAPEGYTWEKGLVRRTRLLLNPDHDALGSFKPTLIQNGWAVKLRAFGGRYDQAGPLAWKDGCVVNEAGQKVALH
jgi:hypothetical protein